VPRRIANSDESIRLPRTTPGLWPWQSGARMDTVAKFVSVYLRLALGTAFLSAVADRFGLWGPPGARNASWGGFAHFMSYTAQGNPWAPAAVILVLAGFATAAETVLGIALVLGFLPRLAGSVERYRAPPLRPRHVRGDGRKVSTRLFGVLGLCRRVRLVCEPISPMERGRTGTEGRLIHLTVWSGATTTSAGMTMLVGGTATPTVTAVTTTKPSRRIVAYPCSPSTICCACCSWALKMTSAS